MVGALRFFYLTVLNKAVARPRNALPEKERAPARHLSPDEAFARLIEAALHPFYRTILMTLYATGMRRGCGGGRSEALRR